MQIYLNGLLEDIPPATLTELMSYMGLAKTTGGVAIALNEQLAPRSIWDTTMLQEHDRIEILHAVQGG